MEPSKIISFPAVSSSQEDCPPAPAPAQASRPKPPLLAQLAMAADAAVSVIIGLCVLACAVYVLGRF